MTAWFEAITQAMDSQEHLPYGRSKAGSAVVEGASKQVMWQGQEIMHKGDHCSCVYTVLETLLDAVKILGFEDDYSVESAQDLRRWCFIYDETKREGIAGGMSLWGWGGVVPVSEALPGDVAQIWDTTKDGRTVFGHCVVILGEEDNGRYPTLKTYSAEPDKGNVKSWRYVKHPNPSVTRQWIVGRFDAD